MKVTRDQYLKALDIVENYHANLNRLKFRGPDIHIDNLKAGDKIIFDKSFSKYIQIGKEYTVTYVPKDFSNWNSMFWVIIDGRKTKRMKKFTQGYSFRISI